jgi:hypothetical protein
MTRLNVTRRRPAFLLLGVVVALVLVLLGTSGIVSAYWRGPGDGLGTGSTGAGLAVSLSPGTPVVRALYPGGRTDVVVQVSNPNNSTVRIGSLSLAPAQGTGGFAVDVVHFGCSLSTLSFTTQTNAGAGWTIPGRAAGVDGVLSITLTNALAMALTADNACQGANFGVYLTAGT